MLAETGGEGAHVVIEATGAPASPGAALQAVRRGGDLVIVGLQARPAGSTCSRCRRGRSTCTARWPTSAARTWPRRWRCWPADRPGRDRPRRRDPARRPGRGRAAPAGRADRRRQRSSSHRGLCLTATFRLAELQGGPDCARRAMLGSPCAISTRPCTSTTICSAWRSAPSRARGSTARSSARRRRARGRAAPGLPAARRHHAGAARVLHAAVGHRAAAALAQPGREPRGVPGRRHRGGQGRARGHGVTFYSDVNVVDDGVLAGWRWVYFADPDGYPLELVENAYERPGGHADGIRRYLHGRPPAPLARAGASAATANRRGEACARCVSTVHASCRSRRSPSPGRRVLARCWSGR